VAKTELKLNATDRYGNDITTTISYVNPDAGKNDILNFTQALNALTTNTYKETKRVQTLNVDLETVPSTPTLTPSLTQWSASTFVNTAGRQVGNSSILTYNGDGDIFIQKSAIQAGLIVWVENDNNAISIMPAYLASNPPTFPVTFTVGFTATDNYKACSVEMTITA